MTAIAQSWYMTGRHLRFLVRQPWFIGIVIVQPVIWLLLFGQLFKNVTQIPGFAAGGGSYLDYLTPGVLVMSALFTCGWSGMGVIEDIDRAVLDRFLVSPVRRVALISGRTVYEVLAFGIQAAIIGGLAWLLGAHFASGPLGFVVLTVCAMLVGGTFASFSAALALVLRQRESVIGINTFLVLPLSFLSAAFLPLALVPEWIATVAKFNPINWAVEAGRAALLADPDWSLILPRIGGLAALMLVSVLVAIRAFSSYQRSI
jgi:ABC-2 type transport system permease protein